MPKPISIPLLGDNRRTRSPNTFSMTAIGIVTFIAVLSSFLDSVLAAPSAPQLVYPLQAQRPPVARVGVAYSWTILPGTFNASSGSTLTLTSRSLPSWIDFDSASATFSGNPRTRDVGSHAVTIVANVTGVASGATDAFTLLVVTDPGPDVFLPFSKQLSSAAYAGGGGASLLPDGTLKVPPSWSFSLGFQQYTFQDQTNQYAQIYYTSYAAGTTQLPSWLKFDNRTVTFGGVAPSTPGDYSIVTYGSNYFGYGDVQQTLVFRVGAHILTMAENLAPIRTTPSSTVSYHFEFNDLRIDNASVTTANLSINVNLTNTSFLTYDASTQTISGTVPSTLIAPQNFTIPVLLTDQDNGTLATNVSMAIYASLFAKSTPSSIQLVAGQTFSQNLSSIATSTTATYSAIISPSSAQQWAQFDPRTLILSGTAPTTVQNVSVAFTAVEKTLNLTSQDSLIIAVVSPSSTSTGAATSAAAATGIHSGSPSGLSRAARLGLALGLGLGLGLLLLVFIAACLWRRKNKKRPYSDMYRRSFGVGTPTTFKFTRTGRSSTIVGPTYEGRISFEKRQDEKVGTQGPQYEEQQRVWAAPVVLPGGMEELSPRTVQSASPTQIGGFAGAAAIVKSSSSNVIKRFDLMGMFRSATGMLRPSSSQPATNKADISLPIVAQQNSLRGLGLSASSSSLALDEDGRRQYYGIRPNDHDIVDMRHHDPFAAPVGAGRHADDSGSDPSQTSRNDGLSSDLSEQSRDESHLERSSTWASGASSSLFYSESDRDSRHHRAGPERANKPRVSVPQQRKDFQALVISVPPRTSSAVHAANDSVSWMGSSSPSQSRQLYGASDESQSTSATGIRLVASHTNSSGGSAFPPSSGSSGYPVPRDTTDASLGDASFASSQNLPPPHVRPFTQERRVSSSSQAGSSYSSQTALRGTAGNRNSAIEDADESAAVYTTAGGTRMSARPVSAVYEPPSNDSRTISAVIYPYLDERDSMATTHQGRPSITASTYSEYTERGRVDSVRLIPGTVANSPFALSPTTPGTGSTWRYPSSLSGTSTIYSVSTSRTDLGMFDEDGVPPLPVDPIRVQVNINEPFRFHVPLPLQHSSSSTEFEAYLDPPGNTNGNRQGLPGWITFDETGGTKEVSGCARRANAGVLPILIVERSQPRDSRHSDELVEEQERVVARYEIEVAEREPESLTYPEGEEPQGELRIISY
ncbi:BQ5605_C004g02963 [Microbotryum silenes-dioicae]|uniref:BQ5605_C004g02963 protein n=1 Tax=Microbotryum silenes-dioicae TaxID=796604 RepID=A0A2X0M9E7_9BASI|nr:BQ5605_C004g02963 [Microbotryum silenes-dioicae]